VIRPDVPELVRGLTQTLGGSVLPQLAAPWAQAQVRYALGVLDTVAYEWDGAADAFVRENTALQVLCRSLLALAGGDAADPALAAHADALAAATALAEPSDLRLSTLGARNAALWQVVVPLIELSVGASEQGAWVSTVRDELGALLRGYVQARGYRLAD